MAGIGLASIGAAPVSSNVAAEVVEVSSSGSFKASSSFLGVGISQRSRGTVLCYSSRRCPRASAAEGGQPKIPASHKSKATSLANLEQLRNSKSDRYTSEKSRILVIGLSIHTASVELREKLAVPEAEWPRAIEELCNQHHIEEAAVLSTCNRMEIYVVALSWHRGVKEVTDWMSETSGVSVNELREHLFILGDKDATQHLFRVSSGLDSLVLGEGQILAQVKQVFKVGQGAIGFGRNLSGLFKQAITAGKRVREETNIAAGAVSVSSAAVELAAMKLSDRGCALDDAEVMIVGAGKMSKLLVKHLISKGCKSMVIVNRTEGRVDELRSDFPEATLEYEPLGEMMRCASDADVIFTSTASEQLLFLRENVESMGNAPTSGMRYFIDISVPRNVGACVGEVAGVSLFNVDHLKEVVAANKEERARKAVEAGSIIDEELKSFAAWRDSLETVPTIKKLRAYAERIRVCEVEKCLGKMMSGSSGEEVMKKQRRLVEDMSRGIVNKLLHGPMQNLRSDGSDGRSVNETLENMHALERMFDLKSDLNAALEQQLIQSKRSDK